MAAYHMSKAEHQSNDPIEDTHEIIEGDGFIYCGIYDGHGGPQTSRYLREVGWAKFEQFLQRTKDPKTAFEQVCPALDQEYTEQCLKHPKKAGLFAGSCYVATYFDVKSNCVWVANLGDSRCVLGNVDRTGWTETVEMTWDHSAGVGKERHAVQEAHPHDATCVKEEWDEFLEIYVHLVKNICMFTRSIGDAYMKNKEAAELYNPKMDPSHKVLPLPQAGREYISNFPEVTVRKISSGDSFLVVACDGLWDEMSNAEAVQRASKFIADNGTDANCAQHLIDYALEKAAKRLYRQEPELGVKTRADLLKIPPGREGRKYLHDDITVSVIILKTDKTRLPGSAGGEPEAETPKPKAKARWGEIKRSVDMIRLMKGKGLGSTKWHSLMDDLKPD